MTKNKLLQKAIEENPPGGFEGFCDELIGRKRTTERAGLVLKGICSLIFVWRAHVWGVGENTYEIVCDALTFYWYAILAAWWLSSVVSRQRVIRIAKSASVSRWTAARYC